MICPQCHATIDDGASVCPVCHAYVDAPRPASFLFCEGCGARLSAQERVCPKCGRPAPAILSSESSASDLAAGKTASFPKISQSAIETELPRVSSSVNARSVLDDALDPSVTHVLDASDLAASAKDSSSRAPRVRKGVVAAVALAIAAVAVVAFFVLDPLHVTPGLVDSIRESAEDMFPSRQQGETTDQAPEAGKAGEDASDPTVETIEDSALSDDSAYEQLHQAYEAVVAINDGERFADAITSFNASYLDPDLETRKSASAGAYALRDELQGIIDDLDAMNLADGSAYTDDREHVRQLALWMYERVDVICASWDISLAVPEDEYPFQHEDEILAPMREAGSSALDNYYAHVGEWEPQEP